jgi:hypothetical protein
MAKEWDVAIGHGGENAFLQGQYHLHVGSVHQGVKDGVIPGRRIEENKPNSGTAELLDKDLPGGALL